MGHRNAPHVLYVAWGFPPCRSGGVYRALATANGFADHGWDVTVLTATRDTFTANTGADLALEESIDPRIRVERIPFAWPAANKNRATWPLLRKAAPRVWWHARKFLDQVPFPEPVYGPWSGPLQAAAQRIHHRHPVDLVVATANPNVDFMAADALHRTHGVPYVMDYRDAWMLNVFDGTLVHPEGGRVDKLETRLLHQAAEVWFVNEPIRAWHAARHGTVANRMQVVANGYDPAFAPTPRTRPVPAEQPVRFGYIGTASSKVPLTEFAAGWRVARRRGGPMHDAEAHLYGYLGFTSEPSPHLLRLVEDHAADGMRYHGPVSKTEVAATYDTFDAALLILGTGRYVTSGKVFEYTATATPIVSVHDPSNAASDVLRGYPLWFPVIDLRPESIAEALTAAADAARTATAATRENCLAFAQQYQRDVQLSPRIRSLTELVTKP